MAVRPILTTGIALVSAGVIAAVPALNPSVLSPQDKQVVADVETSLAANAFTPVEEPLSVGNLQSALSIIAELSGQAQLGGLAAGLYADELQIVGDAFARGGIDEVARIASGEVGAFQTTNDDETPTDPDEDDPDEDDPDEDDEDDDEEPAPDPGPGLQDLASMFLELYMNGGITAVAGYASLMLAAAFTDPITPIPGDLMEIFFFGSDLEIPGGAYYQRGFVGMVHYVIDTVLTGGFSFPDFGLPDFGIPGLPFGSAETQLLKVGAVETAEEEENDSTAASVDDQADPGSSSGIFERVTDRFGLSASEDSEDVTEDETADDKTAGDEIADDETVDDETVDDETVDDAEEPAEAVDESAGEDLIKDTESTQGAEDVDDATGTADAAELEGTAGLKGVELETKPRLGLTRLSEKFTPGSTSGGSLPQVGAGLNKALDGLTDPDDATAADDGESSSTTGAESTTKTVKTDTGKNDAGDDGSDGGDDE